MLFKSVLIALAASQLVAGHGAIIKATGDAGGNGQALGIDDATLVMAPAETPSNRTPPASRGAAADACGETLAGGDNSVEQGTQAMLAKAGTSMPQVSQGGSIDMTVHQVNGDGAGPYTCAIDATGTGTQWTPITVTQNVPGERSRSDARAQDFQLSATIPADQQCSGSVAGENNVCMVRCMNTAPGPFGGCVPVQMAGGAAAGNGTAGRRSRRSFRFAA